MENRKAQSFKQLEISAEKLPGSMARNESRTDYAAQRAELLLGCYRTGEANDPKTYVAAVTAVLSHFPEEVITAVTHPVTGLPKKSSWLPTIKEVNDACNEAIEPIRQHEARLKRIKEQLEMREREDRGEKPTLEQLKEKYGENWGLQDPRKPSAQSWQAPAWDQVTAIYAADPERLKRLLNSDAAYARGDEEAAE
jgi:hypothetical protein